MRREKKIKIMNRTNDQTGHVTECVWGLASRMRAGKNRGGLEKTRYVKEGYKKRCKDILRKRCISERRKENKKERRKEREDEQVIARRAEMRRGQLVNEYTFGNSGGCWRTLGMRLNSPASFFTSFFSPSVFYLFFCFPSVQNRIDVRVPSRVASSESNAFC